MTNITMPHETDQLFLTDAGFETWLLFTKGFDMPYFAAYPLSQKQDGQVAIREYFVPFFDLARQNNAGLILDTNTWRANPDWGLALGHDLDELSKVNREAVAAAQDLRQEFGHGLNVLVNGVIGPRGDGYDPKSIMSIAEATVYHGVQIDVFAKSGVDMVSALTLTNIPEAIGVANAAAEAGVPCVISFTLETDGHLPTGDTLADAIALVDEKATVKPAYFMINCAHPDHFTDVLLGGHAWTKRISGLRANASRKSHAELDSSECLDDGDPVELAGLYAGLRALLPNLNVFGGCCGTDHRHVSQICKALAA